MALNGAEHISLFLSLGAHSLGGSLERRSFNTTLYYSRHLDASQFETFSAVSLTRRLPPFAQPLPYSRILAADYKPTRNVFSALLTKVQLQPVKEMFQSGRL